MATMTSTPRAHPHSLASRRNPPFSIMTDTPTPASSTSASASASLSHAKRSTLLDSLNHHSHSHSQSHSRTHSHSRPLKPISASTLRLDHLEPIHPDDTELERQEHERSFERMIHHLQQATVSASSASSSASSHFQDESASSDEPHQEHDDDDDDEEDGSIRIGLSGVRYHSRPMPDDDPDDLTYMTIPAAPSPAKENVPFLSTLSPRPLAPPPPLVSATKTYTQSPLNPVRNSPVLARPVQAINARRAGAPVTIEEVSDHEPTLARPPRVRTTPSKRASATLPDDSVDRLPNMTFLTEALASPPPPPRARALAPRSAATSSTANSSLKSKEAPLIEGALSRLNSKLASLELENQQSCERVKHLELQLEHVRQQQHQTTRENDDAELEYRREMKALLDGERERRSELERLVQQLMLTTTAPAAAAATEPTPAQTSAPEQSASKRTPQHSTVERPCRTAIELKDEVKDLRFGLQSLGYEVEGVKGVVEGLLRDKEVKVRETAWNQEENERIHQLSTSHVRRQDPGPNTPPSERLHNPEHYDDTEHDSRSSVVSAHDLDKLRREQQVEIERRTPRKHHSKRQARARPVSVLASSEGSDYDSTYVPPSLASSYSSARSTSTILTEPSSVSSVASSDREEGSPDPAQPDFDRAEKIFREVVDGRAERRKRREQSKKEFAVRQDQAELCKKCLGKRRERDDVEDKHKEEQERLEREEKKVRRQRREREQHRLTLQTVLERLELEFKNQKKIYLELTVEYQSMGSRSSTKKRRALAQHLKMSIDVLEEKAREVKQYADALEDLYHSAPDPHSATAHSHNHHDHHRRS
ncbi:uncharacterized protein JCM15063_004994 [Sporobolomyces koalae]|uniref:uncharacterized protein n=1 Tax=Sporobolomyces koalae TaxID=500713 RepID=UPI00317C0C48